MKNRLLLRLVPVVAFLLIIGDENIAALKCFKCEGPYCGRNFSVKSTPVVNCSSGYCEMVVATKTDEEVDSFAVRKMDCSPKMMEGKCIRNLNAAGCYYFSAENRKDLQKCENDGVTTAELSGRTSFPMNVTVEERFSNGEEGIMSICTCKKDWCNGIGGIEGGRQLKITLVSNATKKCYSCRGIEACSNSEDFKMEGCLHSEDDCVNVLKKGGKPELKGCETILPEIIRSCVKQAVLNSSGGGGKSKQGTCADIKGETAEENRLNGCIMGNMFWIMAKGGRKEVVRQLREIKDLPGGAQFIRKLKENKTNDFPPNPFGEERYQRFLESIWKEISKGNFAGEQKGEERIACFCKRNFCNLGVKLGSWSISIYLIYINILFFIIFL